jgi:hypothetical protein
VVRSGQDAGEEKESVRVSPANREKRGARSAGLEPATFSVRSWFARMRVRPNVSEDLAYLCRLRHFIAALFPPLFGSVLVRLQYIVAL